MAAELPRPGVEVIQKFRSVSPTVITPTLVPCVVGVCKQIVDVLVTTAAGGTALNTAASVPLPALALAKAGTGDPGIYTGLDGLKLVVSINNSPNVTTTFVGASLSTSQVVAQVLAAFSAAGVTAATAEKVGTTQWRIRTYGANEFQSIKVVSGGSTTDAAVLAAFGFGANKVYIGASVYDGHHLPVQTASFPDPRKNLAQLSIDPASVRAFLFLGGASSSLVEFRRTQTFLRNALAQPAVVTGSVNLTSGPTYGGGGTFDTLVLTLSINGGANLNVTFAAPANAGAVVSQINAVIGAVATASLDGSNHLVLTTLATNVTATIQVVASTAVSPLGLTATTVTGVTAIKSIDDGNGDAVTPLLRAPGQDFTTAGAAAVVTGTVVISSVTDGFTLTLEDGDVAQTVTFSGASTPTLIASQINGMFGSAAGGHLLASVNGSTHLVLTSLLTGAESVIKVVGGTALSALGLTVTTVHGTSYPPFAGDDLYIDGVFYATITQVTPGAVVTDLRIDKQVPISANLGSSFYIVAKNLVAGTSGRPTPDLVVDGLGNISLKQEFLRDTQGTVVTSARGQVYVAYKAVRQDVSALAKSPGLLRFNSTDDVLTQLAPVSAENPLALGAYFATLNAPGTQVTALGVDAASAAAPFGTVEAYTRAATLLESFEVYAVAPLTHDVSVGQVYAAHATNMSLPENKGERISLFNPSAPSHKLDTLVASGASGNSLATSNTFDTGVSNLGTLLLAAGINPVGALAVSEGVYLDVGDGNHYAVVNIAGPVVTVKTSSFSAGDNDDGFYATTTLPATLISSVFAVRVRGAALVLTDGTPDKDAIALTYQGMAASYLNRRFWHVIPDAAAATLEGVEQRLDGFYMCAAIAGMIGQQPPQQSFTNFPMVGFTRVFGSNDFLSERQLNVAAAGGNYIIVQDAPAAPLIARFALTTDLTSIETRTDSVTKIVDFTAKFMRRGLKNFIGRFNITQGLLDSLGHVIQGLGGFLVENGVLIGMHLNNIIQDTSAPDTVLIDVTLDVPFPCNFIRLTLTV